MEWVVGVLSGLISAAIVGIVAYLWQGLDLPKSLQQDVDRPFWEAVLAPDQLTLTLTNPNRRTAKGIGVSINSTRNITHRPRVKRVRKRQSLAVTSDTPIKFAQIEFKTRADAHGTRKLIKRFWLSKVDRTDNIIAAEFRDPADRMLRARLLEYDIPLHERYGVDGPPKFEECWNNAR